MDEPGAEALLGRVIDSLREQVLPRTCAHARVHLHACPHFMTRMDAGSIPTAVGLVILPPCGFAWPFFVVVLY